MKALAALTDRHIPHRSYSSRLIFAGRIAEQQAFDGMFEQQPYDPPQLVEAYVQISLANARLVARRTTTKLRTEGMCISHSHIHFAAHHKCK